MKKIYKQLICFVMILVLSVMMTVPVMAYGLHPTPYPSFLLNIYGNVGDPLSGRPLDLYKTSSVGQDQNFSITSKTGYPGYYMFATQNSAYAVNKRTSDNRAIMWAIVDGEYDSRLVSMSTATIELYHYGLKLTARTPIVDHANVYFGGSGYTDWSPA